MATFNKTTISKVDSSYQISVKGSHENRKAVITKFAGEKTWTVAKWFSDNLGKADDIDTGYKKLSHAKDSAEFFVDLGY